MLKKIKVSNVERMLVLASIVICVALSLAKLLAGIDHFIHDTSTQFLDSSTSSNVSIIAVDDQSIESLGRWPWTRNTHAAAMSKLNDVAPKLIILNFLFSEPEDNSNLSELKRLSDSLADSEIFTLRPTTEGTPEYIPGNQWLEADFISSSKDNAKRKQYLQMQENIIDSLGNIDQYIAETLNKESGDTRLSQEVQRNTEVLMPVFFYSNANNNLTAPPYVSRNAARFLVQGSFSTKRQSLPPNFENAIYPIRPFGKHARMGHLNYFSDNDGITRSQSLLLHHNGQLYPSLALTATAASLGFSKEDILYQPGGGILLGKRKYRTDENLTVLSNARNQSNAMPLTVYSYKDVLSGDVEMEEFRNKIVILGVTANSLSSRYKISNSMYVSGSELLAQNIQSLTEMSFSYTPPWAKGAIWLFFAIASMLLIVICPLMNMRRWFLIATLSVVTTFGVQLLTLNLTQIWLPLSPLYALYTLVFLLVNLWKLSTSERVTFETQVESSENNRALGLTYQGQGQLDLAFDKFRRCKPDPSIADALYGLGLDFERKRSTHKARLVYQYIEEINPSFRDVEERIAAIENRTVPKAKPPLRTSKNTDVTVKRSASTTILELPTFGRYHVEKKIGIGGMGAVYLGRDPKIDRKVAIKTLEFSLGYSGEALQKAKKRFYREAMAVGKLNHRNIVTLYDVGEDHDLAYIAMEYLSGSDLGANIEIGKLLPFKEVVTIGIACADALDYAHNSGVVHRDIKPSNIIYQSETRKVWVTDFGIALIIDNDITRTQSIFGSPRYMSPEQIKGEPLDGRSDVYSLGVTLFHLLSGRAPYIENEVSAITYSIVHNPTPELTSIKAEIPKPLSNVIFKSMQKNKEQRYSTAAEMKDALKVCLSHCQDKL